MTPSMQKSALQAVQVAAILEALAHSWGYAAIKLVRATKQSRADIDRNLRWLKRRGLVEHVGAWKLTEQGMMSWNVAHGREP